MSDTKRVEVPEGFTPGPWRFEKWSRRYAVLADIDTDHDFEDDLVVAEIAGSSDQCARDAALISLAPTLAAEVTRLREDRRRIIDVIPMDFLQRNDAPGATGPSADLDLVAVVRDMTETGRRGFERVKALKQENKELREENERLRTHLAAFLPDVADARTALSGEEG